MQSNEHQLFMPNLIRVMLFTSFSRPPEKWCIYYASSVFTQGPASVEDYHIQGRPRMHGSLQQILLQHHFD